MVAMAKDASLTTRLLKRLSSRGPGCVFTTAEFLDMGGRAALDQALSRLCGSGRIQRVARGIYQVPRIDPTLGAVAPSGNAVADALAARYGARLQLAGGAAAHALGLTDQVPLRTVYLTDGNTRRIRLGVAEILLKRTSPRQMAPAGRVSGTVIQALRHLGRGSVTPDLIAKLRATLSAKDKAHLVRDLRFASSWVADAMRAIAQEQP